MLAEAADGPPAALSRQGGTGERRERCRCREMCRGVAEKTRRADAAVLLGGQSLSQGLPADRRLVMGVPPILDRVHDRARRRSRVTTRRSAPGSRAPAPGRECTDEGRPTPASGARALPLWRWSGDGDRASYAGSAAAACDVSCGHGRKRDGFATTANGGAPHGRSANLGLGGVPGSHGRRAFVRRPGATVPSALSRLGSAKRRCGSGVVHSAVI